MSGLFFTGPAVPLAPQKPNICILPSYCVDQITTLAIKEKAFSWSGDDFQIKDSNGIPVLICKGQAFSMRGRKVLTDMNGNVLFQLCAKLLTLRKTYVAQDLNGTEIMRVVKKFAYKDGSRIYEYRNWKALPDLPKGRYVGRITRNLANMRELWLNKQTYIVSIAAGVDLALITAICICLDEAKNDKN